MLEAILYKLYSTEDTPEILVLRPKVESISRRLDFLKSIEPQTDSDYRNIPLVLRYVKLTVEFNLGIANIYII